MFELWCQLKKLAENGGAGDARGSEAGANCLNLWNSKRERESVNEFLRPGMC